MEMVLQSVWTTASKPEADNLRPARGVGRWEDDMTDPITGEYRQPVLDLYVKMAWSRGEAVPCSNCGSVPDDWVCEPDHCHSCLAT